MAMVCEVCGARPHSGNSRSHSMRATKRWFKPNILRKYIVVGGEKVKIHICARCYKKMVKTGEFAKLVRA